MLKPMLTKTLRSLLPIGVLALLSSGQAWALPGQSREEVASWIQANPTFRPSSGEVLLVRKSDTPAKRYEFEASFMPPGRLSSLRGGGRIRSERLEIFDIPNGVTVERLEESLRSIYGLDIYQDYQRADVVYSYPTRDTTDRARRERKPLLELIQGELRRGERFAYWIELAPNRSGRSQTGKMIVFLKSDLDKIETELRNR